MEGLNTGLVKQEKKYDPMLETLWNEYDFPGTPPILDSAAEKRLRDACSRYSVHIDADPDGLSPEPGSISKKKFSELELERRTLHNQIAIMTVGKQRSGMDSDSAFAIANFAYELSKGYKISEIGKYRN